MATLFVKPLLKTLLSVEEMQDCGIRCSDLFLTSPLGTAPGFVQNQTAGIAKADADISAARQYEKKNSFTGTSKEADNYRDRRYSILNSQVASKIKLDEDEPEMAAAARAIKFIMNKHCKGLANMDRVTETVNLKNLFAELDLPENSDHLENAEVTRYYLKLKEAQTSYDSVESQKLQEAIKKGEYIKPDESADKIHYRLEALFTYLDALVLDNPTEHSELLNSVNEVIDSVVIPAKARKTRNDSSDEGNE